MGDGESVGGGGVGASDPDVPVVTEEIAAVDVLTLRAASAIEADAEMDAAAMVSEAEDVKVAVLCEATAADNVVVSRDRVLERADKEVADALTRVVEAMSVTESIEVAIVGIVLLLLLLLVVVVDVVVVVVVVVVDCDGWTSGGEIGQL